MPPRSTARHHQCVTIPGSVGAPGRLRPDAASLRRCGDRMMHGCSGPLPGVTYLLRDGRCDPHHRDSGHLADHAELVLVDDTAVRIDRSDRGRSLDPVSRVERRFDEDGQRCESVAVDPVVHGIPAGRDAAIGFVRHPEAGGQPADRPFLRPRGRIVPGALRVAGFVARVSGIGDAGLSEPRRESTRAAPGACRRSAPAPSSRRRAAPSSAAARSPGRPPRRSP